jgi:hypothetical protein
MSQLEITRSGIRRGSWQGTIAGAGQTAPRIEVTLLGQPLPDVALTPSADRLSWGLTIPIPPEAIEDGIRTVVITDADTGTTLHSFSIIAGQALGDDIRAEIDLLRAELEMLKRAFRRHCTEGD